MQSQPIPQIPPNHSSDNAPLQNHAPPPGLLVAARWPPAQRASLKPYSWQECNHSPSLKSPQITVQTMPPSKPRPAARGFSWPPGGRPPKGLRLSLTRGRNAITAHPSNPPKSQFRQCPPPKPRPAARGFSWPPGGRPPKGLRLSLTRGRNAITAHPSNPPKSQFRQCNPPPTAAPAPTP